MKHLKVVLLSAVMIGVISSASAVEMGHFYAFGDAGQTSAPSVCDGIPSTMTCTSTAGGFDLGLGYQIAKQVAVEASYINGGSAKANGAYGGLPANSSASISGFGVSLVGALPVTDIIEVIGKVGVASLNAEAEWQSSTLNVSTSASNTNLIYGIGMRFAVSKAVGIRVTYDSLGSSKYASNGNSGSVSMVTAGLQVGF